MSQLLLFQLITIKNCCLSTLSEPNLQLQIHKKLDSFFVNDFDLYRAIMFFPNGSAAGPDKKFSQFFKDLVSKSDGSAGPNFLKSLTKLINLIGNKNIRTPRTFVFWRKAYRPHKYRQRVETDCHRQQAETYRV